jgi:hypothetical protein
MQNPPSPQKKIASVLRQIRQTKTCFLGVENSLCFCENHKFAAIAAKPPIAGVAMSRKSRHLS